MNPRTLAATAIGFIAGEIASGGLKEIGNVGGLSQLCPFPGHFGIVDLGFGLRI